MESPRLAEGGDPGGWSSLMRQFCGACWVCAGWRRVWGVRNGCRPSPDAASGEAAGGGMASEVAHRGGVAPGLLVDSLYDGSSSRALQGKGAASVMIRSSQSPSVPKGGAKLLLGGEFGLCRTGWRPQSTSGHHGVGYGVESASQRSELGGSRAHRSYAGGGWRTDCVDTCETGCDVVSTERRRPLGRTP